MTLNLDKIAGQELTLLCDGLGIDTEEFARMPLDRVEKLLRMHERENTEFYGAESSGAQWAAQALEYIANLDGEAVATVESGPVTVAPIATVEEKAEIVLSFPPAPPIATVEFDTVEAPKAEPKAEKPLTEYGRIKSRLKRLCQPSLVEDFAALIYEMRMGRLPLRKINLSGWAGLGKSRTVEELLIEANYGLESPKWTLIQPGTDSTVPIIKKLLIDNFQKGLGNHVIFFLDEYHAFDSKVLQLIKPMTDTGGKAKEFTVFHKGEEHTIVVDPRKILWIVASNTPPQDSALTGGSGRFDTLQLLPYALPEMKYLVEALAPIHLPGFDLSTQVITAIAKNIRPFARSIITALIALRGATYEGYTLADAVNVGEAFAHKGYYPGGWKRNHFEVMAYLGKSSNGRQVKEIATGAMKGANDKEVQQLLSELGHMNYIITLNNGRKGLTEDGAKALKKMAK